MEFVKVGRLNKAFGTKGQIKVISDEVYEDDLLGAVIWFVEKSGGYVPYFVESAELGNNFLVKFEDIPSPEAAKSITGAHL